MLLRLGKTLGDYFQLWMNTQLVLSQVSPAAEGCMWDWFWNTLEWFCGNDGACVTQYWGFFIVFGYNGALLNPWKWDKQYKVHLDTAFFSPSDGLFTGMLSKGTRWWISALGSVNMATLNLHIELWCSFLFLSPLWCHSDVSSCSSDQFMTHALSSRCRFPCVDDRIYAVWHHAA